MRMARIFIGMMILSISTETCVVAVEQSDWDNLIKYEFGKYSANYCAIETEIRTAPAEKFGQYEDKLIAVLNSQAATYEAKEFACRMLRLVGSEKSVPALAGLLADEKMGHISRYALQSLPCAGVDEALRSALSKTTGKQKAGIIASVGIRKDSKAVPLLKSLVAESDMTVVRAAISALGRIAGADALEVLTEAKVADGLKPAVMESRLMCADELLAQGKDDKAADVYRGMLCEGNPAGVQAAAIIGLARAGKNSALPAVLEMLKSRDGKSLRAAGMALQEIKGDQASKAIADAMGSLSADAQVIAINVLVANGSKAVAPDVAKLTGSPEKSVKLAAIRALAELGDVSSVALLANLVKDGSDVGRAVVDSLVHLPGKAVSEAIMKSLANVDAASRAVLIGSLAERQSVELVPDLLKCADDSDENVRAETFKVLGVLIEEKERPALVGLMLKAKPGRIQAAAERAVQVASARVDGEDKKIEPLLAAMKDAKFEERAVLLHCLGCLGGEKALEVVRANIMDKDENVQEAAIRAMADWSDDGALPDLRELAKNAPKDNLRIIAFRGLVRLVSLPDSVKKDAAKAAGALVEAMGIAPRMDEKMLVLGALSGIPSLTALDAAQKYVQDEALRAEAELACVRIIQQFGRPGAERDRALAVLKTIAETTKAEHIRKQAMAILGAAK